MASAGETTAAERTADRKAHPLARRMWLILRDQGEADQLYVFHALQRRLRPAASTEKQDLAVEALRRFDRQRRETARRGTPPHWALGPLSAGRYEEFRRSRDEPSDWPSSSYILKAFGRWLAALGAAGLEPAPDVRARSLVAPGSPAPEELLDLIRLWAGEVDRSDPDAPLLQKEFFAWARKRSQKAGGEALRVPSRPRVAEILGTWTAILQRLGLLHRHVAYRPPAGDRDRPRPGDDDQAPAGDGDRPPTGDADQAPTGDGNPSPAGAGAAGSAAGSARAVASIVERLNLARAPASAKADVRDRMPGCELIAWLRWLAAALDPAAARSLRRADYDSCRRALRARAARAGRPLAMPASGAFAAAPELGSWTQAKIRAGLLDREDRLAAQNTRRYQAEALEAAVRSASAVLGRAPRPIEYERWRARRLREAAADPTLRVPSQSVLRDRLGGPRRSWRRVLASVSPSVGAAADAAASIADGRSTAAAVPSTADAAPFTADAAPSTTDAPSTADTAPSTADAAPSTADAAPSTADAGR